jgi:hypothetical protein
MSSTSKSRELSRHAYSPAHAVGNTLEVIRHKMENPDEGIRPAIPGMQGVLTPWGAKDLVAICGFTSNGKSSLANYIITQHAQRLRSHIEEHPEYNHICAYFTWEQSIEEQTILDFSRMTQIDPGKILTGELNKYELERITTEAAQDRERLPIWLVGHSIKDDRRRPRLSMPEVLEIVIWMEDEVGLQIDMIVLDYLQRVKRLKSEMRESFVDIVDDAKDLALRCPVLLPTQAKREVFDRKFPLPDLTDSYETSNLEQSSDVYLSVMMPKQKMKLGAQLNYRGASYTVTDKLLFLGLLKQKMGPAPIIRAFEMGYGGSYMNEWLLKDLNELADEKLEEKYKQQALMEGMNESS